MKGNPYSLVIRAEKEGLPVKISDVARVNGEFPSSAHLDLSQNPIPTSSPTVEPVVTPVSEPGEIIHQAGTPTQIQECKPPTMLMETSLLG